MSTESPYRIDAATQDLLFRTARTPNAFRPDAVSDEQMRALYDLVQWGPSTANTQPLRMVLVRSPEAKARLVSHLYEGNRAKTESAPLTAILAANLEFHERMPELFPHAPGMKDLYADDGFREQVARSQAWLQAGYFILGVRAIGLAAGPMLGIDHAGIDADLLAGTDLRTICVVNIGTPAENAWFDRLPRLPYDEVFSTL